MQKFTEMLEEILAGGVVLGAWIGALIVGVIVFSVSSFIGAVIFGSWVSGVILGLVVTFGGGYVLYKLGSYLG